MELTDEQRKMIENCEEAIKKISETISEIWNQLKEVFIQAYEQLKEFLNKKVSIKTKSFKKGNKYIHSYKHIELWKIFTYRKE